MKFGFFGHVLFALIATLLASGASATELNDFNDAMAVLQERERSIDSLQEWQTIDAERRLELRALLKSERAQEFVGRLGDDQLKAFFVTIYDYVLFSPDPYGHEISKTIYEALDKRRLTTEVTSRQYADILYLHRDWSSLVSLKAGAGIVKIPSPPKFVKAVDNNTGREIWFSNAQGDGLLSRKVDMRHFTGVIFVGSNGCGFSRRAGEKISTNRKLSRLFQEYGLLLVPPTETLTTSALTEWGIAEFGMAPAQVASRSDWPDIPRWSTPNFYFFKNGKMIQWVRAWPFDKDAERMEALLQGFKSIGLLSNAHAAN